MTPTIEQAQSLQRIIMTMNSGCCPQCGVVTAPGGNRVDRLGDGNLIEFHGLECDLCWFRITDNQVRLVAAMKPNAADLSAWQAWAATSK